MKKILIEVTTDHFIKNFSADPDHIFMSPGRINIIGEHVDYNDGFVLPAAIDKYICFAISESGDDTCAIIAKDLNDEYRFNLKDEVNPIDKMWANYILGVLRQMIDRNLTVKGFNVVFSSSIPIGSGMSSSAALECGFGFALNEMYDLGISKKDLALMGQRSEHEFVGVKCGIMDQFASVFGLEDKVIKLDCITLDYEYHNGNFGNYSLLLLDSNVKHTHLTSGYNDRRNEVHQGLEIIQNRFSEITSFRDCTKEQVEEVRDQLGEVIYRRCLFVVTEIQRVLEAVEALEAFDYKRLGDLMFETHEGLSKQYEVSCEELDFLVDAVKIQGTVIGARMMGGGFGGCSINLVEKGSEDALIEKISADYKQAFGIEMKSYKVNISEGTSEYF